MTHTEEQAKARDLAQIAAIMVLGTRADKRRAAKQRRVIYQAIHQSNIAAGLDTITDDQLYAELGA